MIDGFKVVVKDTLDKIRSNPSLDFLIPSSVSTGFIIPKEA
jgi:hypothetical protein